MLWRNQIGTWKNMDLFWKGMPSSVCRAPFVLVLPAINRRNKSSKNAHMKMLMLLKRSSRQMFSSSLYGKRLQHVKMYRQTATTNANLFLSSCIRHQFQITNRIVLEAVKCETTWMNPLIDLWLMISLLLMRTKGFMPFLQNLDDAWSSLLDWSLPFAIQAFHHEPRQPPVREADVSKFKKAHSAALRVVLVRNWTKDFGPSDSAVVP